MWKNRTPRSIVTAALAFTFVLSQVTWALAGTTGNVSGTVTDESGASVSGVVIRAVSASETRASTTDAKGTFSFLNLAPDTYTLSVEKEGYNPISYSGVTVFADQTLTLSFKLTKALKTIAKVSARAAGNLVKAGTTSDVYSINEATAKHLATAAGGYNLDNAYSAIASQPGVYQGVGSVNFGQVFYIRGSSYGQVGYEFDGVPVNRAFDNYNASSLSNLGSAQTEVYTGGSPASASAATLGGYINQVIKTGTYPGYGSATGALGAPAFYHKLDVEGGGSTPDRLFSWYVGLRGGNFTPNFITAKNGADLDPSGNNAYGFQGTELTPNSYVYNVLTGQPSQGPWSTCLPGNIAPAGSATLNISGNFGPTAPLANCSSYAPLPNTVVAGGGATASTFYGYQILDRENVFNFHIGVPHHKDGGRDDIQLLYNNFSYHSLGWDNLNSGGLGAGPTDTALSGWGGPNGLANFWSTELTGAPLPPAGQWNGSVPNFCAYNNFWSFLGFGPGCTAFANSPGPLAFQDSQLLQVPFGSTATSAVGKGTTYFFPSSPQNRPVNYGMDPNQVGSAINNGSIIKAQYTKNIGSSAFVRLFGYTFYSDWLQNDPNRSFSGASGQLYDVGFNFTSSDYEVAYHTRGVQLQAADQINAKNLVTLTGNYTLSIGDRANNSQADVTAANQASALIMNPSGQCFSGIVNNNGASTPKQFDGSYPLNAPVGTPVSCLSVLAGAYSTPSGATTASVANVSAGLVPVSPVAGTDWLVTQNIQPQSNVNRVSPRFTTVALQDEFRPSDRWDINVGARYESFQYVIPSSALPGTQFWVNEINNTACVAPIGLVQANNKHQTPTDSVDPLGSSFGYTNFTTTAPGGTCPFDSVLGQQLFHPGQNGIPLVVIPEGSTQLTKSTWSPRVGWTYTLSPDSVLRFTYGRYTQPTPTYAEQVLTYLDPYQQATKVFGSAYYNNGLNSTIHDNPIQFSNNWDLSFEHHFKGTDLSMKLSPFYRYTTSQVVSVALAGGLAGGFNAGTQRSEGIEFQMQKGDPTRNGLSGQFSYTFTDARIKYGLINGNNAITGMQSNLTTFWNLTKNNPAAAQCYSGGAPDPCSDPAAVINPYYNLLPNESLQSFLAQFPIDGWYPTYANYFPSDIGGLGTALDDLGTAIPQNVFSGFLAYKHNKWLGSVNMALQQGARYGSPTLIEGLDPTSCIQNQAAAGVPGGGQLADYQSCAGVVPIPNPATGRFDAVAQYTNPWIFNLGGQISYDFSPRISATVSLANILNTCFGGSSTAWSSAYKPNAKLCSYSQGYNPWSSSPFYLAWSPGEAYNTAGAGYFYGSSPASPVNGTAGYPNVFNYPYIPVTGGFPFQAYFQLTLKI